MPGLDTLGANGDGDGCLVSEYRTTCFIDRDKIRLHFQPPPPFTDQPLRPFSCMNHVTVVI